MSLPIFQRTIVDSSGNIQPGASVAVRNETTGDLVTIYADREGGTAKANPFLADSEGFATFYVEPGEYQVTATTPAGSITWSHVAIGDTALLELEKTTGSALVGYLPAGTGAIPTTVQSKLRKFVALSDKGITTAGAAAANTTAMQALIDEVSAAGGGDIAADEAGTYNFLQLKPKNGVRLLGYIGKTIFKLDNSAASNAHLIATAADGSDGSIDDFSISGLILDGNGKDATFVAYGCKRLRFTDAVFQNSGTYGCGLQARPGFTVDLPQEDVWFTRCGFKDNGSDGVTDGLDIKHCTNVHLVDCWSSGNTDAGFNIRGEGVSLTGCYSHADRTGFRFQATDLLASYPSRFVVSGCIATGCIDEGFQVQASALNETHIDFSGVQSIGNGTGFEFSGAGLIYGAAAGISAVGNTGNGVLITGNFIGHFVFSGGVVSGNGVDGVNTTGKNTIFDALRIVGNTGTGYRENVGADNNYLATNCVVSGNGTDIGTRIGAETDDGFVSARSKQSVRVFPGLASGLEMQTDSGGTHSSLVAVGDAASVDLRLVAKGSGDISGFRSGGASQLFIFREAGSATVNYPDMVASLTGAAVQYRAAGSDTNIDVALLAKGTGVPQFGGYTANADAPVVGYITIKDAGGTVRRLAVIG